jgi:hypothetical protein
VSKKPIFYVCAAIVQEKLLMESITALSEKEAVSMYKQKYGLIPSQIEGPFLRKKVHAPPTPVNLKFNGIIKPAIYQDWKVNAFFLESPENHAFLVFLKNLNSSKDSNKNTTIVPIIDLRFE